MKNYFTKMSKSLNSGQWFYLQSGKMHCHG